MSRFEVGDKVRVAVTEGCWTDGRTGEVEL